MQTTEIRPQRKWFDIDLKGLWRYRDLYYMYIRRDIVTQYKQTILGPLWYVIQPLFTTIMYMFVFGGLAGIVLWGYFSQCFTVSSDVFGTNANVFGKVYFPRLVVPLSGITSNLLKMLIQLGMFIIIYILCDNSSCWYASDQCINTSFSCSNLFDCHAWYVMGIDYIFYDNEVS